MDDSFGSCGFNTSSTSSAEREPKAEGVVPVVIRQLQEVSDNSFSMWGMTFEIVTCIAIARNIEKSSTKVTYLLEDHTGQIDAHHWIEEEENLKLLDVMLNNYARVYARISHYLGKKTLMIIDISPVTDVNELTTHLLEVLNARYSAEKFWKKSGENNLSIQQSDDAGCGLDAKQLVVYQTIKNHVSEDGISLQELQCIFRICNGYSALDLKNIIDFLILEGHIFTTIDSEHFRSSL